MKYIVMEVRPSYAVVLDENGCFRKAANLHYEVGQTVTEIIEMKTLPETEKKRTKLRHLMSGAVAAAACLLLLFTSVLSQSRQVYASVYLTINPEVRIDVNKKDRVVELKAENEDGKTLLEGYSYKKKELDTVTEELVARAAAMGFLREGGRVSLSLDAADPVWIETHQKTLSGSLAESVEDGMKITIEITDRTVQDVPGTQEDTYGESDYDDVGETGAEYEGVSDYESGTEGEPEDDAEPDDDLKDGDGEEASSPYGREEDETDADDRDTDSQNTGSQSTGNQDTDDADDEASGADGEDGEESDSGYED